MLSVNGPRNIQVSTFDNVQQTVPLNGDLGGKLLKMI